MKRFHRRCRWLCILAALLVLLVLFLRQNVLLDTASRHAILLDTQSGRVLAQKRADERTAPASLTKMMTVLLAIEAEPDLDKQVTLPEDIFPALQTEKASMAGFMPGETVTVRDLLYGAMLPSGAECCEALARLVSGSEENFAALMNQKAAELGMKNTHFTNATGLTDAEHYSSAADMAKLLQAALHNVTFRTGKGLDLIGGSLIDQIHQKIHALADGAVEGFLLVFDDFLDVIGLLGQLGVSGKVLMRNGVHDLIEEGLGDAQQPPVTGSPAEQPAKHIAPSGVGGGHAVADHKGGGTDVVGDDPEGDVAAIALTVGDPCDLGDLLHDVLNGVYLKEVLHALHDAGQTL